MTAHSFIYGPCYASNVIDALELKNHVASEISSKSDIFEQSQRAVHDLLVSHCFPALHLDGAGKDNVASDPKQIKILCKRFGQRYRSPPMQHKPHGSGGAICSIDPYERDCASAVFLHSDGRLLPNHVIPKQIGRKTRRISSMRTVKMPSSFEGSVLKPISAAFRTTVSAKHPVLSSPEKIVYVCSSSWILSAYPLTEAPFSSKNLRAASSALRRSREVITVEKHSFVNRQAIAHSVPSAAPIAKQFL